MKQKVYLHIGFGKTGTSAIQGMLVNNYHILKESAILYPKTGLLGAGQHLLAKPGLDGFNEEIHASYQMLTKEIEDSGCEHAILSSEYFCFCSPGFIREMARVLKSFQVKVVFYIRAQVKLIESVFLQWVKAGDDYRGDLESFYNLHEDSFDFLQRIRPWVDAFGEEAIVSRLFDKRIVGQDVCNDFSRLLELNVDFKHHSDTQVNPSLLPEFFQTMRLIDNMNVDKEKRGALVQELLHLSGVFRSCASLSLMNESLAQRIRHRFEASNREFAQCFLTEQEAVLLNAG